MKIRWPYGQDSLIQNSRSWHNAAQPDGEKVNLTDALILLQEMERRIGKWGDVVETSLEYRIARIETLLGLTTEVPEEEVVTFPTYISRPRPHVVDGSFTMETLIVTLTYFGMNLYEESEAEEDLVLLLSGGAGPSPSINDSSSATGRELVSVWIVDFYKILRDVNLDPVLDLYGDPIYVDGDQYFDEAIILEETEPDEYVSLTVGT